MKVLVALFIVLAVAQASGIDWTKVYPIEVLPKGAEKILTQNGVNPLPAASRIVGGDEATLGQFPYQIGMFAITPTGTGFCGGSILNENWILTAAHCVDTATSVTILFAAQNVRDANPEQYSVVAKNIIVHEKWDRDALLNDIALLELPSALTFSDLVQPTRLPSRSQASKTWAGYTGTVSGWGRYSNLSSTISAILRWTSNPILTNFHCKLRWLDMVGSDQICLSADNGRSSCTGDSGGPLVVVDDDGAYTQVGIVSFGSSLGCTSGWPSVYTRPSAYLDWIEANTDDSVVIRN